MEVKQENVARKASGQAAGSQMNCRFAETPVPGMTIGVVSAAKPSSLTLLAAGIAGMAERRARREQAKCR